MYLCHMICCIYAYKLIGICYAWQILRKHCFCFLSKASRVATVNIIKYLNSEYVDPTRNNEEPFAILIYNKMNP